MFELSITVKDSESKYKRDFLIYDHCSLSLDDPVIKDAIETTVREFNRTPDTVKLNFKMDA